MLPLRISETTSNLACSRQMWRCVAQLSPTIGVMKPGGGMSTWKRPLLSSRKFSRPGRLVKALGHHTMQPNILPDMECTMFVKKPTRRSIENIDQKSSEVYGLANQFRRENADVVGNKPVKNNAGEMSVIEDSKAEGLVRALPKASQCWVWLGHRPSVWWTISGRPSHPNHKWYG